MRPKPARGPQAAGRPFASSHSFARAPLASFTHSHTHTRARAHGRCKRRALACTHTHDKGALRARGRQSSAREATRVSGARARCQMRADGRPERRQGRPSLGFAPVWRQRGGGSGGSLQLSASSRQISGESSVLEQLERCSARLQVAGGGRGRRHLLLSLSLAASFSPISDSRVRAGACDCSGSRAPISTGSCSSRSGETRGSIAGAWR